MGKKGKNMPVGRFKESWENVTAIEIKGEK